jgi:hypothetical protein
MPLPMVHLTIAVQAHALADQPLTSDFLLGSLAPDAIHMRANTNREDKDRVHLRISETSESEVLERIRLWIHQNHPEKDVPKSFVEGYAAHLLADHWWVQEIAGPFALQLPPDTSPTERQAWYYRETDQLDLNLYHRAPWRPTVWDLLAAAVAPEFSPYLAADEISRWRHRTLDWYENPDHEPGIVPQIITERMLEGFIKTSVERIRSFLFSGKNDE